GHRAIGRQRTIAPNAHEPTNFAVQPLQPVHNLLNRSLIGLCFLAKHNHMANHGGVSCAAKVPQSIGLIPLHHNSITPNLLAGQFQLGLSRAASKSRGGVCRTFVFVVGGIFFSVLVNSLGCSWFGGWLPEAFTTKWYAFAIDEF